MGEVIKRLGATVIVANTATTLYTCPTSTMTAVSRIVACNQGSTNRTIKIAHVDGVIGSVSTEDYIVCGVTLLANKSMVVMDAIGMEAADTILVNASHADVTFIAWGSEIT